MMLELILGVLLFSIATVFIVILYIMIYQFYTEFCDNLLEKVLAILLTGLSTGIYGLALLISITLMLGG